MLVKFHQWIAPALSWRPHLLGLIVPAFLLVLWELSAAAGWVNSTYFPAPTRILSLSLELMLDGTIWDHFSLTAGRLVPALLVGTLVAVTTALVMAAFPIVRKLVEPSLLALSAIPKIALLPIFLAALGVGPGALFGLISTSVFFYVWIYALAAVMRSPVNLARTAEVFGASRIETIRGVVFRSALPEIMSGTRVGATVGLLVCLTSEAVLGTDGLGHLVLGTRYLGLPAHSYVGILVAASFGLGLQQALLRIERVLIPWSKGTSFDPRIS